MNILVPLVVFGFAGACGKVNMEFTYSIIFENENNAQLGKARKWTAKIPSVAGTIVFATTFAIRRFAKLQTINENGKFVLRESNL